MGHRTPTRASFLLLGALLAAPLAAQTSPEIRAADLRRHVEFLASDELQGRATGTPEGMKAAHYLAAELKRMGVEPAGEDGTYFQKVPLGRTEFLSIPTLEPRSADGAALPSVAGVDFELSDGGCELRELRTVYAASQAEVPAKPDAGVALVLLTESTRERNAWLRAVGPGDGASWGLIVSLGSESPGARPMGRPPSPRSHAAPPYPSIRVRGALRTAFEARSVETLAYQAPVRIVVLEAVNVLGKVTASAQSRVGSEVVMFSAHYDHLAPKDVPGTDDRIFNGADDDASGCAVVLELAEAFAVGAKPTRQLLFFFASGEEIGLVGTRHFLEQPLVPLDKLVLDINFEMLGRPDPMLTAPARMWLTGYERSDLGELLRAGGAPVVADFRPEEGFFQRSDNYALAQRGIVAQTLSSFGLHTDYHKVTDQADRIDYEHLEACGRGAYVGCFTIALGTQRPQWREGMDPSKAAPPQAPPDSKAPGGAKKSEG